MIAGMKDVTYWAITGICSSLRDKKTSFEDVKAFHRISKLAKKHQRAADKYSEGTIDMNEYTKITDVLEARIRGLLPQDIMAKFQNDPRHSTTKLYVIDKNEIDITDVLFF